MSLPLMPEGVEHSMPVCPNCARRKAITEAAKRWYQATTLQNRAAASVALARAVETWLKAEKRAEEAANGR